MLLFILCLESSIICTWEQQRINPSQFCSYVYMCVTGSFVAAELERDVEHVLLRAGNLLKNKFDFPFKLLTNRSGGKPERAF